MNKFYDTSSLLLLNKELSQEKIIISSISLTELEEIKSSSRKDEEVKAAARQLLHWFDVHPEAYHVVIYNSYMLKNIEAAGLESTNDAKILASALY